MYSRSKAEHAGQADRGSRRAFLRRAATVAVGAGAAGAALAPEAAWAAENDPRLIARGFRDIRKNENDHVSELQTVLGPNARPKPTFQNLGQASVVQFVLTARKLENTLSGAYTSASPNFLDRFLNAKAISLAVTEGRHAGWLDSLLDLRITTNVFGRPLSFEGGLNLTEIGDLTNRFIVNLNGGPPLFYNGDPTQASAANDIAILNFLLALEYLESDFYNFNVPRLFAGVP